MKSTSGICCLAIICLVSTSGCGTETIKKSYHDGAVIVELVNQPSGDDYMTFRFQKRGEYAITFSKDPKVHYIGGTNMPKDFSIEVTEIPHERFIKKNLLRCLRVTITLDNMKQHHDLR